MFDFFSLKDINSIDKKYKIDNVVKSNTSKFRQKVKILVIDDKEFTPLKNLQQHGYTIHVLKNLPSIETIKDYQIILCDLKGVGLDFNREGQGAYLIKEIKKAYPSKIVIAYTGGADDAETIFKAKKHADNFLLKDADIEEWTDNLDRYINDVMNPVYSWKIIRVSLLEQDVSPYELAKLEDKFVNSLINKNINTFDKYIKSINLSSSIVNMLSTCIKMMQIWNEITND